MKKKIISIVIAITLLLLSFYYTSKSIDIVKNIDPIMQQIEKNKEKYEIKPQNAIIKDNTIIPGISGKEVDKKISYSKMKRYGTYNESLTTLKKVEPQVSIKNNYDKYIIKGNNKIKQVSLIFKVLSRDELILITNYLIEEKVQGTLLIDEELLDQATDILESLDNYEIDLMYNKIATPEVASLNNYLESITGSKSKLCVAQEENIDLINSCKSNKIHTVKPNIVLNNNPTVTIKKDLKNGSIILVEINTRIKKELDYIVDYINSKGYSIVKLENLIKE